MSKGLENINEVFKETFDDFEANVDPSVWNNIQSSIASGSGGSSMPKIDPTTTSVVGKSIALKIVAGIIAVGTIATGTYFAVDNSKAEEKEIIAENIVLESVSAENKTITPSLENVKQREFLNENNTKVIGESVVNLTTSSENNELTTQIEETESPIVVANESPKESKGFVKSKEVIEAKESSKEVMEEPVKKTNPNTIQENVLSASIIASTTSGKAPLDVTFDVEGENITKYFWNFGDNSQKENGESVFHIYEIPGTYKVELTVIDKNANSITKIKFIKVEDNLTSSLGVIPNVFTPNGDGKHDVYKVTGENIATFNAQIMSQNGRVVYIWNSIDGFWDGTDMAGNKLPFGTYYIDIQATGSDGKSHTGRTSIHLLSKEL